MTNCLTPPKCIEQEIVTTHKIISSGSIVSVTLTKKQNADCTIDFVSLLDANGNSYPSDSEFISVGQDVVRVVIEGGGGVGGGGSSIDYTALITAIKTSVQGIDADTNALAPILLAVDTLEAIGTTGNATSAQILTAVSSILTQAQATSANTDQLESLLTSFQTTLQTESDQTQAGLVDVKDAIEAIPPDVEYLPRVDYVAAVTTPILTRVFGTVDMTVDELVSGTGTLWNDFGGALPHPPNNEFFGLDAATTWKWYGFLNTTAGKTYIVTSSANAPQSTIKVFFGSDVRQVTYTSESFTFVGDGTAVQVGYLFEPNTSPGGINDFFVERDDSITIQPSCSSFVRKIVNGVATDYAEDGITPYVVQGVVKAECPALFLNGSETAEKSFVGYKSLEIVVLDGSVSISDGTNTTTYPQVGANQTVVGVNYDGGVLLSNTITVTPTVSGTNYTWSGVL
jgi:hypothetical protein